ncbi:hypothetical protein CTI12_AA624080 [Artemisia annua]|uniref:Uncharacterized protein n=1 Tax=Artemisia annua TaxID=35608 RepID=A0A2U1KBC5_ARTAN|nr:hypothetical protein CTI12_AA624080 [Artemisia annua]
MAEMRAKVENLEKELKKTSSSMPENFNQNGNMSSQSANEGGTEKIRVVIDKFMRTEFLGNHMFDDLMVPKIGRHRENNRVQQTQHLHSIIPVQPPSDTTAVKNMPATAELAYEVIRFIMFEDCELKHNPATYSPWSRCSRFSYRIVGRSISL